MNPYWKLLLGALDDFMLKFLLVCAVIDLVMEVGFSEPEERKTGKIVKYNDVDIAWIEGFAIFMGVFIVAGVGSYNDYQKEK